MVLNWEVPFSGGKIGYAESAIVDATGWRNTAEYSYAVRFTREELKKMIDMQLTKVAFAIHSQANVAVANTQYFVRIWTGGNANGPEKMVHEQAVSSYSLGAWNEISLSTPIDIDVYEDLWIGLRVYRPNTTTTTRYTSAMAAGDVIVGKTDLLFMNNAWSSFADANWAITGFVEHSDGSGVPTALSAIPYNTEITSQNVVLDQLGEMEAPSSVSSSISFTETQFAPLAVSAYEIYRDGELITTISDITQTSYTDAGRALLAGDYEYCVVVIYEGGVKSALACQSIHIKEPLSPYVPAAGLAASWVETGDVSLSWTAPAASTTIGYHNWNGGLQSNISAGTNYDLDIAIRWAPGDLAAIDQYEVRKLRIFVPAITATNALKVTYSARV